MDNNEEYSIGLPPGADYSNSVQLLERALQAIEEKAGNSKLLTCMHYELPFEADGSPRISFTLEPYEYELYLTESTNDTETILLSNADQPLIGYEIKNVKNNTSNFVAIIKRSIEILATHSSYRLNDMVYHSTIDLTGDDIPCIRLYLVKK